MDDATLGDNLLSGESVSDGTSIDELVVGHVSGYHHMSPLQGAFFNHASELSGSVSDTAQFSSGIVYVCVSGSQYSECSVVQACLQNTGGVHDALAEEYSDSVGR